ncbi:hypothetical protein AAHS21_19925 [Mycobacterium sp. 050272]
MSDVPAIADYVEEILAGAPELSEAQRVRLVELLAPVRRAALEVAS